MRSKIKDEQKSTTVTVARLWEELKRIIDPPKAGAGLMSSRTKDEQQKALIISAFIDVPIKQMRELLALGVDPNGQHDGETALTVAAKWGDFRKVIALIKAGAEVNLTDGHGQTALDRAVYSDSIPTVKALIAAGADVTTERRHPLLYGATRWGRTEFVEFLLKAGVNPRRHIRKILRLASENGDAAMVRALLTANQRKVDKRALVQPLISASARGDLEMVHLLLKAGADPTIEPRNNSTALMGASEGGYKDIVQVLLENGAPVDTQSALVETRGYTALMIAAEKGHPDIVRLLLDYGADSQQRNKSLSKNGGFSAEDLATGEAKAMLVACRERQKLREVSGVKDTDQPVQKKLIM
jgi:ankyrin repeat protein